LHLRFTDLTYTGKDDKYDLNIGQTLLVKAGNAENLTFKATSEYKDISYRLDDSEDGDEQNGEVEIANQSVVINERLRSGEQNNEVRTEVKRKEHQDMLLNLKMAELKERFDSGDIKMEEKLVVSKKMNQLKAYKSQAKFPQNKLNPGKIFVDEVNQALLLPISKSQWLPIHISLVKSVSLAGEGQWHHLRINLHVPGVNNLTG